MAEQLRLQLRECRGAGEPLRVASSAVSSINWRRVSRRASQVVATMATGAGGVRAGFALRDRAERTALVEALRGQLAGKTIKRAARGNGRMPVKAAVLLATSRRGRRLHRLVDRIERQISAREATALCG